MILEKASDRERESFDDLQKEFTSTKFLCHHESVKQLYIDMDASKERGHGAMIYHLRDDYIHTDLRRLRIMKERKVPGKGP
jgi:hypothetical protein